MSPAHTAKRRNTRHGSTLDGFLAWEGVLAARCAGSSKEVLTRQLHQAMKKKKLSKNKMAARIGTSRARLDRLLDPKQGNVTLETLHRAAQVLGRELRIELT